MKIELTNRSFGSFELWTHNSGQMGKVCNTSSKLGLCNASAGEKKLKLYEAFACSMPSASALLGPFALLPSLPRQRRSQKDSARDLSLEIS